MAASFLYLIIYTECGLITKTTAATGRNRYWPDFKLLPIPRNPSFPSTTSQLRGRVRVLSDKFTSVRRNGGGSNKRNGRKLAKRIPARLKLAPQLAEELGDEA
jgi:hypothetical protein